MPTEIELRELQNHISSTINPILSVSGVSNPVNSATVFGIEMFFRFMSFASAIRTAIEDQKKKLDESVRSEDILRVPIEVDTTLNDVLTFFVQDSDFPILHPEMASQFADEIEAVKNPTSPYFAEGLRVLAAARRVIPRVERKLQFTKDPIMDQVFASWLDPSKPDFRMLVYDFVAMADRCELSLDDHLREIPNHVKLRLRAARLQLNASAERAAAEVNDKIRVLIRDTLFGEKGAIQSAVKFAVDRRVELIDADLKELNDRKTTIEARGEGERSEQEKRELKDIARRINDLVNFKTRVKASAGA